MMHNRGKLTHVDPPDVGAGAFGVVYKGFKRDGEAKPGKQPAD